MSASPAFSSSAFIKHRYDSIEGFTKKYRCHRLVYYESYQDVQVAIGREKQIKRWRREKKIALIEKLNPRWQRSRGKLGKGDALSGTVPG
jgi:predicted GIY-YIG superfamily endonuclease